MAGLEMLSIVKQATTRTAGRRIELATMWCPHRPLRHCYLAVDIIPCRCPFLFSPPIPQQLGGACFSCVAMLAGLLHDGRGVACRARRLAALHHSRHAGTACCQGYGRLHHCRCLVMQESEMCTGSSNSPCCTPTSERTSLRMVTAPSTPNSGESRTRECLVHPVVAGLTMIGV